MKHSRLLVLFSLATIVNLAVFIFRDQFQYHPYRNASQLYKPCNEDCKDLYKQDYKAPKKMEELETAKEISKRFLPDTGATAFEKITLITDHIYSTLGNRSGRPAEGFRKLGSLEQYILGTTNPKDSFWCGIYTGMVSMFAWPNNVVTRQIEIKKGGTSHMVVEAYLPEENKWMLTDPTFGLLALKGREKGLLDLQSFRKAIQNKHEISVLRRINGQLADTPLDSVEVFASDYGLYSATSDLYYHSMVLDEVYQPVKKIQRYLLPVSWYDQYAERVPFQPLFYLKLVLMICWVAVGGLLLKRKVWG